MAAVLLALGIPLAVSLAAARQQEVVVDRIDDTARFASLAQFVTERPSGSRVDTTDGRRETLKRELEQYYSVYGIKAGVFYREKDQQAMANAPYDWGRPTEGEGLEAFEEALLGRRPHDPKQVWPWQEAGSSSRPRSSTTVMSSPPSSPTRPPTRCARRSCAAG